MGILRNARAWRYNSNNIMLSLPVTMLSISRPTERGYFPRARTNRGPGALVNANVDACTVSYYNPFYVTKMHKIALFSSIF